MHQDQMDKAFEFARMVSRGPNKDLDLAEAI
ncbi:hypothetical protein HDE79_003130 [Rhodanobacter sp. MP1X3]|nr:hypothetical protein [Rhodanobacter sp. MP1X3]